MGAAFSLVTGKRRKQALNFCRSLDGTGKAYFSGKKRKLFDVFHLFVCLFLLFCCLFVLCERFHLSQKYSLAAVDLPSATCCLSAA